MNKRQKKKFAKKVLKALGVVMPTPFKGFELTVLEAFVEYLEREVSNGLMERGA
jgi:hypothetical protein